MRILKSEYVRKDERGELIQVNTGIWQQLNHLKIKKGGYFGGHYHKHKTELFYLIKGKATIAIEFLNSIGFLTFKVIPENNYFLIEPFEKHTIYPEEDCEFIELLSLPYSEQDTFID